MDKSFQVSYNAVILRFAFLRKKMDVYIPYQAGSSGHRKIRMNKEDIMTSENIFKLVSIGKMENGNKSSQNSPGVGGKSSMNLYGVTWVCTRSV